MTTIIDLDATIAKALQPYLKADVNRIVVGPSGIGKTAVASALRRQGRRTIDLDVVGYRTRPDKWKEWIINPSILDVLSEGPRVVACGACSNIEHLLARALTLNWEVIFLTTGVRELEARRASRGDREEKILESEHAVSSWSARAARWRGDFPTRVYVVSI